MSDRMSDEELAKVESYRDICIANGAGLSCAECPEYDSQGYCEPYEFGAGSVSVEYVRAERTFAGEQTHRLAICEAEEAVARHAYDTLLAAATRMELATYGDHLDWEPAINALRAIIEKGGAS